MPELPEVETVARGVDERVRGDVVREVWFGSHKEPFKNAPAVQAEGLTGRVIAGVRRVGKHIVVALDDEAEWVVHLGMTGRLLVTTPDTDVPVHTHARLFLESGRELRFVDARRFGRLEFLSAEAAPFEAAGAEPLTVSVDEFAEIFHARRSPIKSLLLNQSLLSGVGNIYADESLFHAGIRPRRLGSRLRRVELAALHAALQRVLTESIASGGSSVSDYVDAAGVRGFFQLHHMVYSRTGEPCRVCGTVIERITLGGRSTHFCKTCQR